MKIHRGSTPWVSAKWLRVTLGTLVLLNVVAAARAAWAQRAQSPAAEKVIYNFAPATGDFPAGVIRDAAGNLYVATTEGGGNRACSEGCGSILELTASGRLNVLYNFIYTGFDKLGPHPNGLVRDAGGNLYATTMYGGSSRVNGSVFKLTPSGNAGLLHSFGGGSDGLGPTSGVTLDTQGNLYGTTPFGGSTDCASNSGCGVVYKVTRTGTETVLYTFTGGEDGAFPVASPILDSAGNLYGTAADGGDPNCPYDPEYGCGTVWKLDTAGNLSVLYTFTGGTDGAGPNSGLVSDSFGNLYGTASGAGDPSCACGVVFELNSCGIFTVLHTFLGGSGDGEIPLGALLRDATGNLYGTTIEGGDQSCVDGCGIVFKIDVSSKETILHFFAGAPTDGAGPETALVTDRKGNLYGTTLIGGRANGGVIFKVQTQ